MNDRVFNHAHAHKLEDPERLKWMPPAEILSRLHLAGGMRVADIGAGTGYFSIPIARSIGIIGHVFAVDLQPEMIERLGQKLAAPEAPKNISLHQGRASALPLEDGSIDLAFYANIWHELDDTEATFQEMQRITVPEGKIAVLDWRRDKEPPPGPPQDHRVSAESVVDFLKTNGCRHVSCYNVGEFSYLITANVVRS